MQFAYLLYCPALAVGLSNDTIKQKCSVSLNLSQNAMIRELSDTEDHLKSWDTHRKKGNAESRMNLTLSSLSEVKED